MKRTVARWEAKGGKQFIALLHDANSYSYVGNGCGGSLPALPDDNAAIAYMERPWGQGGPGPVTVLRTDFKSVKRLLHD